MIELNVKWFGAKGDGVVDDSAAIQACATSAGPTQTVIIPQGTYILASGVIFTGPVVADGKAIFKYTGVGGIAVTVGTSTLIRDAGFTLPQITRATGVWGTETGLKILNCNACTFRVPRIEYYDVGLLVTGDGAGTGCVYNEFTIGTLFDNKINLEVSFTNGGFCNNNTYLGGVYTHDSSRGIAVAGTRDVLLTGNNHLFLGASFEGDVPEYHVELSEASYNLFHQCRWETTIPTLPKVKYTGDGTDGNCIFLGYFSDRIDVTFSNIATQGDNIVISSRRWELSTADTSGLLMLQNLSNPVPVISVFDNSEGINDFTHASEYTVALSSQAMNFKTKADTQPRVRIAGDTTAALIFGPGGAGALDTLLYRGGADQLRTDDAFSIGEYLEMQEMSEPSAAPVNRVRLFTRDTGGKTQLCAKFNTGAVQVIATEP